ncbi:helix-turn-helix domain-containing protein [Nocardioides sp. REDSEA-S30_B4]|uniref:helix-turn-helix domain-containing protein n=1 Tax=Nocardioides sp. REDSEA-S30_B4 TaxID=1811552 RepID=UPI000B1DFECB|nr:helix-turn-helix domain-containing protein [Nocardioides sp. REDSEA-S30_B4]
MIVELNRAVALVEEHLAEDPARRVEAAALAARIGTTEHHLRRTFASLAGMPLSDYVRRRRMSLAARDLTTGRADLLTVAVRHGYGSSEAFGRAFRAMHGASPAEVRRDGGPLRTQPAISFALTVHGGEPMHTRIVDLPDLRLLGHARRVRPAVLQDTWARTATEWFPSQPWRLREGPEIVAVQALDPTDGSARGELWLPVEPT